MHVTSVIFLMNLIDLIEKPIIKMM